jgi:hypothetical protein
VNGIDPNGLFGSFGIGGFGSLTSLYPSPMPSRRAAINPTRAYFPSYNATVVYVGEQTKTVAVSMATQYQYLIATLITTGIGVGVWVYYELSTTQATLEQKQIAENLNVRIRRITEVQTELKENPAYHYFVHGSQTTKWKNTSNIGISLAQQRINTDFGQGFYNFRADDWRSFDATTDWAIRGALAHGSYPFILVTRILKTNYDTLTKKNYSFNTVEYINDVNMYRQGLDPNLGWNYDVISGPVAKQTYNNTYIANPKFPDQYVFKTIFACGMLEPIAFIPLSTMMQENIDLM